MHKNYDYAQKFLPRTLQIKKQRKAKKSMIQDI